VASCGRLRVTGFDPHDSNWWGLLVRKAALFTELYGRNRQLENLLLAGGRSDAPAPGMRQRPQSGSVEAVPPPNLFIEHFRKLADTGASKNLSVIGETKKWTGQSLKGKVSHGGKQEVRA
jgi:hypothetical protein